MSWNPNSKKHKASHGGYKSKPTKSQVRATIDFFNTSDVDFSKMIVIEATSGQGTPRLGTPID